jgi:hypothetical protein
MLRDSSVWRYEITVTVHLQCQLVKIDECGIQSPFGMMTAQARKYKQRCYHISLGKIRSDGFFEYGKQTDLYPP